MTKADHGQKAILPDWKLNRYVKELSGVLVDFIKLWVYWDLS